MGTEELDGGVGGWGVRRGQGEGGRWLHSVGSSQ